ncbi:ABC transporter substrate-binding protein [Salinispora vitiensis]|uniref:ABC transporter substrate-binding protein n=1 Tax=Salinispora vitiensis TaxID=999544 RepID=UPI00037AC449|nr:ABC transporter substrate-binding protein [Salinispora vitiensis]
MLIPRATRAATLAACATLLLASSACGTDETEEATATSVRLYGTDSTMLNSFPTELGDRANLVNGMKGTTPLTPLPEAFKDRLLAIDPGLTSFVYAAEAYDAVLISALAAQLAGTTDPAVFAAQIVGVTNGGQRCETAVDCLALAKNGQDIEYRGISVNRGGFTAAGEPSTASYATLHFDGTMINDAKTEFVGAGFESSASNTPPPETGAADEDGKGPLVLGGLLPQTGALVLSHPPLAAGAALAIQEINAAGGVLGSPVTWIDGDDGTDPAVAKATVASHAAAGVHVIIGAGASGISRAVLPDVMQAGMVLFSPSNTEASLTELDDQERYFRTAPSDSLQGRALADVILRDGPQQVTIVARRDAYGEGLQEIVRSELERAGIDPGRLKLNTYQPPEGAEAATVDFTSVVSEIKETGSDAVVIIGFNESAGLIRALADAGVPLHS